MQITKNINILKFTLKTLVFVSLTLFLLKSCSKDSYGGDTYTSNIVETVELTGYTINVTASNSQNYTLSGNDANGSVSGNDPEVTIATGETINFVVKATGHPFYLKTDSTLGSGDLVSGATEQGTTNGTVTWTPIDSGTYYYVCSLHTGMYGVLTVE
tara:strand:- start:2355 stop:2825 length:471 start_codon:yes stop_codon:yes gene_type:complete